MPAGRSRENFKPDQLVAVIMRTMFLLLGLLTQTVVTGFAQTDSRNVVGRWHIEVTFQNGPTRSLQFDAKPSGKGSLHLILPVPIGVDSGEPSAAQWKRDDEHFVTFQGPVAFPLGNVGIERGTLVLKGTPGRNADSFTGEAQFFPTGQNPDASDAKPSKTGVFKATRSPG